MPITLDFIKAASMGFVPGYSTVHRSGRNNAVSSTLVPICYGGAYQTPTTAQSLEILSNDGNDTSAGSGAQQLRLDGLDANFNEISTTVLTNGTNAVAVDTKFMRLHDVHVVRSGTYATQSAASQKGSITVRTAGGGATWAVIPEIGTTTLGVGEAPIGAYTVPAGKTAYIQTFLISVNSNLEPDVYFFVREGANDITAPYSGIMEMENIYVGLGTFHTKIHVTTEKYPEYTDMGFLATISAGTADITVEFELLLEDNDYRTYY